MVTIFDSMGPGLGRGGMLDQERGKEKDIFSILLYLVKYLMQVIPI